MSRSKIDLTPLVILMLAGSSVAAETEIHRCTLEDGTIAFQEMPCPEPADTADDGSEAGESPGAGETRTADDDVFDFVNPFDEPTVAPTPAKPALPVSLAEDRAECEKTTRDAIDTIDLEMRETAYTKEQGKEYLAELLVLTEQLRACKQL